MPDTSSDSGQDQTNRQLARAAGTVMLALLFSQLTGLARSILVANTFGTNPELDAFLAANRVPEFLFNLVAGGALASAFIPTFTAALARNRKTEAWRLASAIANLLFLLLAALTLLAAVFAPQIVRYTLAPGLARDEALFTLTIELLRIQLVSALLFGLGGLLVGILNSHRIFLVPALTPAMYQLGLIFGVLVLAPRMGIHGLAWGVVIGATLYLLLQLPALIRLGGQYRFTLGLKDAGVGEVIRLMGPRLLGVAVVQINFVVNTWLASRMEAGSISAIYYGFMLMLMAQAAIAQSIATAAMPTLATQYALGKLEEIRQTLGASLRGVVLLALPACLGLITLRTPIIGLLYQHGDFSERSTTMVAWALLWYAAGLVGHSILEVLARAFYALHDTRTPVLVGASAMGVNILLSVLFSDLFGRIGWMPLGGLALANSLATALEAAVLFLLMLRKLNTRSFPDLGPTFARAALATAAMAGLLVLWLYAGRGLASAWLALGGVLLGGAAYGAAAWLLKAPEIRSLASALLRRFPRMTGPKK